MGLGTYHPPNLNLPYIPNLSLSDGPSPISTSIPGMATIDPAPVTPYSFLSLRLAPFLPQSHQSNPKRSPAGQLNCVGQCPFLFFPTHAQVEWQNDPKPKSNQSMSTSK